jgi:chlorinating enzyme
MLTNKQISEYWENGFSFPHTAFSEEKAQEYFDKFLELEEKFGTDRVRNEINFKTHTILKWCQEIVQTPRVLDYIESLLGPNIICWSSTFFIKLPGRKEFSSFHQDEKYFRPSDSSKTVSVWIGLNDSNTNTGCVQYIPGLQEELPHENIKHKNNLLPRGQTVLDVDESKIVNAELRSGQFSIHDLRILHGSGINHTDQYRIGYVIRYGTPDLKIGMFTKPSALLCRGEMTCPEYWDKDPEPQVLYDPEGLKKVAEVMIDFRK